MIVNTKSAFRIAYKESNRGYSDTLELQGCVSDAATTRKGVSADPAGAGTEGDRHHEHGQSAGYDRFSPR